VCVFWSYPGGIRFYEVLSMHWTIAATKKIKKFLSLFNSKLFFFHLFMFVTFLQYY
jgi:hypothetical protein